MTPHPLQTELDEVDGLIAQVEHDAQVTMEGFQTQIDGYRARRADILHRIAEVVN
jgi:hypothetical protein